MHAVRHFDVKAASPLGVSEEVDPHEVGVRRAIWRSVARFAHAVLDSVEHALAADPSLVTPPRALIQQHGPCDGAAPCMHALIP